MERLNFGARAQVRDGVLTGIAHVYGQVTVDGRRHSFAPGAFAKSIAAGEVMAYWGHDSPFRLGSQKAGTLVLADGPKELGMSLKLPPTSYADDIKALTDAGEEIGVSFEFYPTKAPLKKDGITTWQEGRLAKINLVDAPAFEGTNVVLSSAQEVTEPSSSQILKLHHRTVYAKARFSMPDGSYPINTCADVHDAAMLAHHSKTYPFAEVKAHVMRAKNALKCSDNVLPDTWNM